MRPATCAARVANRKDIGVYEPLFADDEERSYVIRHKPIGHLGEIPARVHVDGSIKHLVELGGLRRSIGPRAFQSPLQRCR